MKIKQEHYDVIEKAMNSLQKEKIREHLQEVIKEGKYKDLNTRIAWDCFWACNLNSQVREWYNYLNDEHLNTAILKVYKNLNI